MEKKTGHDKLLTFVKPFLPEGCLLLKKQNEEDLIAVIRLTAPHKISTTDELCKKCEENYNHKHNLSA
jgi:hypothetical protein